MKNLWAALAVITVSSCLPVQAGDTNGVSWDQVAKTCGLPVTTPEQISSICAARALVAGDRLVAQGHPERAKPIYQFAIQLEKYAGKLADPNITKTAEQKLAALGSPSAQPQAPPVPGSSLQVPPLSMPQTKDQWDPFAHQYCGSYFVGTVSLTAYNCAHYLMDAGWTAQEKNDFATAARDYTWAAQLNDVAKSQKENPWDDKAIGPTAEGRLKVMQALSSGQALPPDHPAVCEADMHSDLKFMNACSDALWPLAQQEQAAGHKEQATELYKRVKAIEDGLGMQSKNPGRGWDAQGRITDIASGAVPRYHPSTPPPAGHYFCYAGMHAQYAGLGHVTLAPPNLVGDFVILSNSRYQSGGKTGSYSYKNGFLTDNSHILPWDKMEYFEDHKHPSTVVVTTGTASASCELHAH